MALNILLTCEDYFPVIGGAEVCVHNLKKSYEKSGHRVTLVTNTTDTMPDDDASIIRIAWRFTPVQLWRHVRLLWRLIGTHDIVHCQYSFRLACVCAVIAFLRRKPMVLTQQGRGIVPEVHPKLHHAALAALCRFLSLKGAAVITSTSEEISILTARYVPRERIIDITNGYDAQTFAPDPSIAVPPEYALLSDTTNIILTVRRLVPKNAIHILVQALAVLKERSLDFHYFAVGDGRMRSIIEELIRTHHLQNHVTLLGKRGNDTLRVYYQHSDVVIVPSSAEATSIACIEAMGMRKPIIASRVGGLIDLLQRDEQFGTLVDLYDTEACSYDAPMTLPREKLELLADAIEGVFTDPVSAQVKADAAYAHVKGAYSWDAIAQRYLTLYDQALTRS